MVLQHDKNKSEATSCVISAIQLLTHPADIFILGRLSLPQASMTPVFFVFETLGGTLASALLWPWAGVADTEINRLHEVPPSRVPCRPNAISWQQISLINHVIQFVPLSRRHYT